MGPAIIFTSSGNSNYVFGGVEEKQILRENCWKLVLVLKLYQKNYKIKGLGHHNFQKQSAINIVVCNFNATAARNVFPVRVQGTKRGVIKNKINTK